MGSVQHLIKAQCTTSYHSRLMSTVGFPTVLLASLYYYYVCSMAIHTLSNDNSYRLVSAFMSQQESATSEDTLHFNFLSLLSLKLAVRLSLLPGHFGVKECTPAVTDNGFRLDDRHPHAGGEVCHSRLHSHFLLSLNPSSFQETWAVWVTLGFMKTQTKTKLQRYVCFVSHDIGTRMFIMIFFSNV